MNLRTQAERDLFDYLSPEGKAEVEEHYAALETEDPDESANEEIDLDEEAVELMVRPEPELNEDTLRDEEREREEEREAFLRNMDDCRSPREMQENDR